MILVKGMDLGLNQLFPRLLNAWQNDEAKQKDFVGQMVLWRIILSFFTAGIGVFALGVLPEILEYPYPLLLVLAVLGSIILGWYEHAYLLFSAEHRFQQVTLLSVSQALFKLIGFVAVLWFMQNSLAGIAAVYFFAPLIGLAIVSVWVPRRWWKPKRATLPTVQQAIRRFWPHAAVGAIAITLINNADILFVQGALESFETGIYAGAARLASMVLLVTYAISAVLNNRVSRYKEPQQLQAYLKKSLSIVLLAVIGFGIFLPMSRVLIALTIGPEYLVGWLPFVILVANALLGLALVPYTSYFFAVDSPSYHSVGGIIQVLIIFLGNILFLSEYGLLAASSVRFIATVAFGVYTLFMIWKTWPRSLS